MLTPEHWTNAFLDQKRQIADRAADKVIDLLVDEHGAATVHAFFDRLIRNIQMPVENIPPYVNAFLKDTSTLPEWADPGQMRTASELFIDHGPKFLLLLYYKSLPLLYAYAEGAQILTKTGRLTHKEESLRIFSRRVGETGQFLLDVMQPGAFDLGGAGFGTVQKIRLIHASVRHFIRQQEWDEQELGAPIHQEQLVITLMTFSTAILEGLEQFHISVSAEQKEAYIHHWNIIGFLLGISQDLLPQNYEHGKFLLNFILERNARSSEDGKLLTHALIAFAQDLIPKEKFDKSPEIFIEYLVGEKISGYLGIQPKFGCLGFTVPAVVSALFRLVEKLEDDSETIRNITDRLSGLLMKGMVSVFNEEKQMQFRIPDGLKEKWQLN